MFETARAQSELFRFSMWSMRAHLKQSLIGRYQVNLTFETARAQTELFAFQCSQ